MNGDNGPAYSVVGMDMAAAGLRRSGSPILPRLWWSVGCWRNHLLDRHGVRGGLSRRSGGTSGGRAISARLVLALAVTIIEVALIVSMMITGGADKAGLARDTVFSAVMIVCNGIVGLCLLAGGVRHREQVFQLQGATAALVVLMALTTLTLVFPNLTTSTSGPTFSPSQLIFAAVISLILYASFLFVQTVRHRDYFLPADGGVEGVHAPPPPNKVALLSPGCCSFRCCRGCFGESAHTYHGVRNRKSWRTEDGCRYCDRGAGTIARGFGFLPRRERESPADQYESCAGFGVGEHWLDDSRGCGGFSFARQTTHARHYAKRRIVAGAHTCSLAC